MPICVLHWETMNGAICLRPRARPSAVLGVGAAAMEEILCQTMNFGDYKICVKLVQKWAPFAVLNNDVEACFKAIKHR